MDKIVLNGLASRLCLDGRQRIQQGEKDGDPELKADGLKRLVEGLIQQNGLRDKVDIHSIHKSAERV